MPIDLLERYASSIRKAQTYIFDRANPDNARKALFVSYLVEQCELAKAYKFPERLHREADELALDSTKNAASAAKRLARILRSHPQAYGSAVGHSMLETGVHLRMREDDALGADGQPAMPAYHAGIGPGYSIRLAELLDAFARAAEKRDILAQRGPFEHRFRCGPLFYPEPKEGRKQETPSAATCLAVFLLFLTRRFTATGGYRWAKGEKIETVGEPLFKLAEELVNDALEVRPDPNEIDTFLRRNPKLTIWGYI